MLADENATTGKTKSSFEDRIRRVTEQSMQSSSYTRLHQAKTKRVFLSFLMAIYNRKKENMSISVCCWPTAAMKMVLTALVVIWPWLQTS